MAALWPLRARNGCAVATVRSKWLCCGHCALEMAALCPLCARNGCAVATVCSKWMPQGATVRSRWPHCGHFALEMVALWPRCVRNGCALATIRLKWLRCGQCALASTVPVFPSESLCCFELCFVRLHWRRKAPYANLVYIYMKLLPPHELLSESPMVWLASPHTRQEWMAI